MIMLDYGRVFKNHDEMNFALHGIPFPKKEEATVEKIITTHMENTKKIEEGSIVYLKSGSPAMTVGSTSADNRLECVWFIESRLERDWFAEATLTTERPTSNPF